jgi:uncharacterized protein
MNAEMNLGIDRVRGAERIAALDVIRGIAILFILYMNIQPMGGYEMVLQDFRYPTWTTGDFWSVYGVQVYMSGTQRGLLELLFGAGIMIMARKAMNPDGPVAVADLHYRRNLWLAAFGLLNAFVLMWWGDILLTYGLAATFLMGDQVGDLEPGAHVYVRFEGGILVPAVVKWIEDGLVGLAFINPVLLDRTSKSAN